MHLKGHVKAHIPCETEIAEICLGLKYISSHFYTFLDCAVSQIKSINRDNFEPDSTPPTQLKV